MPELSRESGVVMHAELGDALHDAEARAKIMGEPFCVVSGRKNGKLIYRIYPMRGFGLPPGGRLEEVVHPLKERVTPEPREKTSTNGF
jgi:hypothetical protein